MYQRRYRRITFFFAWHLLKIILFDIVLPRIGLRNYSRRTRPERFRRIAISYRELAIEMGGVLIKVGQFLSTRVDVLPSEFIDELSGLQDEVPAVDYDGIREVVESEFNTSISNIFVSFDRKPLAAASLGQVHRAKIIKRSSNNPEHFAPVVTVGQPSANHEITSVVVKVQRPDIENIIRTDLAAIKTVGNWINRYPPIRRRVNIRALIKEFTRILFEEIDYLAEGRNAETFAEDFASNPRVRVPHVVWSYTTVRVLTLEDVWGIKITDYAAIDRAGVDRSEVASLVIDTYLKQIFEDGFFHADPHPGNLFVNPIPLMPPLTNLFGDQGYHSQVFWQLTFVDFGMVGSIPDQVKNGLRELIIGIGTKDTIRVIEAYKKMDIILPGADLELIEQAGTEIFELFWGKNMEELSKISPDEIIKLTSEYRELLYQLPFQVPQDLIFLGRTVSILSGICTGLDPGFNIFNHLAPYAQKLILEDSRIIPAEIVNELGTFARMLFAMPKKMDKTLDKLEKGEIAVKMPEVSNQVQQLDRSVKRVIWVIIFAAFLLGGVQLLLGGEDTVAFVLFGCSLISLLFVLFGGWSRS